MTLEPQPESQVPEPSNVKDYLANVLNEMEHRVIAKIEAAPASSSSSSSFSGSEMTKNIMLTLHPDPDPEKLTRFTNMMQAFNERARH